MSTSSLIRTVTTQRELDQALSDKVAEIRIESPAGVWLEISDSGSATVSAYDSATVSAYGSATVSAYGSATVRAYDSATVRAYGSATVSAYGSATVSAYGSATVSASKFTAVHLHSSHVTLDSTGAVIDVAAVQADKCNPATWCEYHGVEVVDGIAFVYKGVGDDWKSPRTYKGAYTSYEPGSTPEALDWEATESCGNGLHFSPTPGHTLYYREDATKFLRCGVRLDEIVVVGDKVKAKRVVSPCVEVTEHAQVVA